MALHLIIINSIITRSWLEPVPRCEPSRFGTVHINTDMYKVTLGVHISWRVNRRWKAKDLRTASNTKKKKRDLETSVRWMNVTGMKNMEANCC